MTATQDPFDTLRDRLIVAAGGPTGGGRRSGLALIVATLVLVLVGAAVAAITLTGSDPQERARPTPTPRIGAPSATPRPSRTPGTSRPPGGRITPPPTTRPNGVPTPALPPNYQVELMPDLAAGAAGWCVGVAIAGTGMRASGRNCEPAGPPGSHLITGGGLIGQSGLVYLIVDRSVAMLDLSDGRRVVPRREASLPPAWRLATYNVRVRPGARPPTFTLRDSAGRELAARSSQAGRGALPARRIDPRHPPAKRCAVKVTAGRGVRAVSARLLASFETLDVVLPAYLSCSTTVLYYRGRRYQAGVLLNARDLRAPAPPLPDAPNSISARRVGPGWLVVFGGTIPERQRVLRALRVMRRP